VKWGPMNRQLFTGHEDGAIAIYDAVSCKKLKSVKLHTAMIQDLQFAPFETYPDLGFFITASKDNTSMIYETATLKVLKTFTTQRPVNSASISPIRNHIILGGGQEAMNVTTTSQRHEKFEVRFFHSVFEDEIARCKGHFGPINTLAWSPDGKR
jgi:translation initiation factor 3 subunit I